MIVRHPKDHIRPDTNARVRYKLAGSIKEILASSASAPRRGCIRRLNSREYIDTRTGEVLQYKMNTSRTASLASLRRTFSNFRDILNANAVAGRDLFLTLTYGYNIVETARLKTDLDNFIKRLRRRLSSFKYIALYEPNDIGWHVHIILLLGARPSITNQELSSLWGHGSAYGEIIYDTYGLGWYLTPFEGSTKCKKLSMYPNGFRIVRSSPNLNKPTIQRIPTQEAEALVIGDKLLNEDTLVIADEAHYTRNVLNRRTYKSTL